MQIRLKSINDELEYVVKIQDHAAVIEHVQENKNYTIIDTSGNITAKGITVLNFVAVYEDGKSSFEERFLNRPKKIGNEPGFIAIRVLRPLDDDTYIVLTQWETEVDFRNWQNSKAYGHAHKNRGTDKGIDKQPGILKEKPRHELYLTNGIGDER